MRWALAVVCALAIVACAVNLAKRTAHFLPDQQDPDHYTIHFINGLSSGVTGAPLPGPLQSHPGAATSVEVQTDTRGDLYLVDRDTPRAQGGLRAEGGNDTSYGLPAAWAHVPPTTQPENGPAQKVDLSGWNHTISTVRNYDQGVCVAHVPYELLAGRITQVLRDEVKAPCENDSLYHGADFVVTTWVGPILATSPASSTTPPITAAPFADKLSIDVNVIGQFHAHSSGSCIYSLTADLKSRMTFALGVDASGKGTRVSASDFALADSTALGLQAPGSTDSALNGQLASGFLPAFLKAVNEKLAIGTNIIPATSIDDVKTCATNADCTALAAGGPEDNACVHPAAGESVNTDIVPDAVVAQLAATNQGVCVYRLEPKRINVTPEGVDIVLIDDPKDPQRAFIAHSLAPSSKGSIRCPELPTSPTDTLAIDRSGKVESISVTDHWVK